MEQLELARFLENKLGWASLLAVQKGISFSVHDDSLATEFGPGSTASTYAAELTGSNCFRHLLFIFVFFPWQFVIRIIRRGDR